MRHPLHSVLRKTISGLPNSAEKPSRPSPLARSVSEKGSSAVGERRSHVYAVLAWPVRVPVPSLGIPHCAPSPLGAAGTPRR